MRVLLYRFRLGMNDSVHILCLPLMSHTRSKLACCGFSYVDDFRDVLDREKLKQHLNIKDEEADHVLNIIYPYAFKDGRSFKILHSSCGVSEARLAETVKFQSAAHLLKTKLRRAQHTVSFSSDVDELLGGGFPLGKITEIAGEAGSGKTQFCFQLCVDVQIPESLGGVGAEAVFLDVEGTFFPRRVEQIADAAVLHCHRVAGDSGNEESVASVKDFTVENIMSHIYVFRCRNSVQLLAAAYQMREFLHSHPKVKLLVVDSVAQCFRGEDDFRSRSKFLLTLGRILRDIAEDRGLSVVCTNQIASKAVDDGSECDVPALGSKWSHFASVKLMLHKIGSSRSMYQYKSPNSLDGMAEFSVSLAGIRNSGKSEMLGDPTEPTPSMPGAFAADPTVQNQPVSCLPDSAQGDDTWMSQEGISRKWIELSQKQLRLYTNDSEAGVTDLEEAVERDPTRQKLWNDNINESMESPAGKSRINISMKVASTLRQSVNALLSSDQPNKPPPTRKRGPSTVDKDVASDMPTKALRVTKSLV